MKNHGLIKVAVGYGKTFVGNCNENAREIIETLNQMSVCFPNVIVLPELAITGYTCADLFNQTQLLESAELAAAKVAYATENLNSLVIFGCPVRVNNSLYNCAIVANKGEIIGIVPKQHLPNYKEFYEERWFKAADGTEPDFVPFAGIEVPFGVDLIFQDAEVPELKVGVEICEDIWMPVPPSCLQSVHGGAVVLTNLSASNETVGKSEYRKALVENQSGRCIAAYAYASCGPTESTTDVVFGGDCLIAENGSLLRRSAFKNNGFNERDWFVETIDLEKLVNERRRTTSFAKNTHGTVYNFRYVEFESETDDLKPKVVKTPFVPSNPATLEARCREIFNIQVSGLAKRMSQLGPNANFTIGVSGGLDSTLALLVAVKACEYLGWNPNVIKAITMPGFGTSKKTKNNAVKLMELLGVSSETIDICPISHQMFKDIGHKSFGIVDPNTDLEIFKNNLAEVPAGAKDVVFENVQARARTYVLMSKGFVIGTGDMSELALGWATYNGDHMSMYNPNCSIPKTLVKFLVKYVAENQVNDPTKEVLLDIFGTTISPELLPLGKEGEIVHSTEDAIGPYELHDFYMFHLVRNGFSPSKILFLATKAFEEYNKQTIAKWLKVFLTRFFTNQFKRSCVPDGPKVGSVSLSPRGDWRMPSDAQVTEWIKDLELEISNEC